MLRIISVYLVVLMDPLAMAGSAMGALNSYKDALKGAQAALEEGKQLIRAINIFEVTVNMIPPRGEKKRIAEMTGTVEKMDERLTDKESLAVPVETNGPGFNANQHIKKTLDIAGSAEATEFVKEQIQSAVVNAVGNVITPLGDEISSSLTRLS